MSASFKLTHYPFAEVVDVDLTTRLELNDWTCPSVIR